MEKILLLLIILVLCYYLYISLNTNEKFTQDIDDVIDIDPKKIVSILPFLIRMDILRVILMKTIPILTI